MVGVVEIGGAMSGLKAALDILKGLKATADAVAINDAKIALQGAIIEAQSGLLEAQETQTANLRRIDELEQEIVRLKNWSCERERYELVDVWRGAMAYMPKPGMEDGKPAHWLCPNCFEQGRRSFLQHKGQAGQQSSYGCDSCKASIVVSFRTKPIYPGQTS